MLSNAHGGFCLTSLFSAKTKAHCPACGMQVCYFTSALLQLARVSASHLCRSYRCIVAGTRFQCPFDPPLVCGILDHWIAELQPHANKRDPVLSRHYAANRQVPWQRCLAELLPLHSLPQSLEHFCDLEHVNDSVVFNSVRAVFKDTCEQMLAKLKPVSDSAERQQELADWMMEGFKEFAPRNKIAPVGSCASGLQTSDSDFNMLMQPHDLQARVFSQSLPPPRQPAEKIHNIHSSDSRCSFSRRRTDSTSFTTSASISRSARSLLTSRLLWLTVARHHLPCARALRARSTVQLAPQPMSTALSLLAIIRTWPGARC
jgi:hypothetical protein